ncbi:MULTISPECIES: hypothetical protein [unclassified Meiothermus]|uniref:hypothetical protein n=1 Tax=unclassified Meiothermus TaxID=370471 RepID=UPI000D7BA2D4|nr:MULTISPECIES: hypothetical protein [unclassified Meiothermus]PZA07154.1 hypothetical protein DNA98_10970 [Meiothermus sp. Pnk-1]RYM39964.1 hypothetical protein EWH23_01980 [Meiothermus sp. PNK-Is4]
MATPIYWMLVFLLALACLLAWRLRGSRYGWVPLLLVGFVWAGDWLFLGSRSGGLVESLGALSLLMLLLLNKAPPLTPLDRQMVQGTAGAFALVVLIYAFIPGLRPLVPLLIFGLILVSLAVFTRRPGQP